MPYLSSSAVQRVGFPENDKSMSTRSVAGMEFCDVAEVFCDTNSGCPLSGRIN